MAMPHAPAPALSSTPDHEDGAVAEWQYPPSVEALKRFDAWWEGMLPEERAFLEELIRADELDGTNHR